MQSKAVVVTINRVFIHLFSKRLNECYFVPNKIVCAGFRRYTNHDPCMQGADSLMNNPIRTTALKNGRCYKIEVWTGYSGGDEQEEANFLEKTEKVFLNNVS